MSDHTGQSLPDLPAGSQPCLRCPIVAPARGERLARPCLEPRVEAVRGLGVRGRVTSNRGDLERSPQT